MCYSVEERKKQNGANGSLRNRGKQACIHICLEMHKEALEGRKEINKNGSFGGQNEGSIWKT